MDAQEKAMWQWLDSGNERTTLRLMRIQRIVWACSAVLFVGWIVSRSRSEWRGWGDLVGWALLVTILASLGLRFAVRAADRRAMEKDLPLMERVGRPPR